MKRENLNELLKILYDYYKFLLKHDFYSDQSSDYIFEIADALNLDSKYFNAIYFDESLSTNGVAIPQKKSIILNVKELVISEKLNFIGRKESIKEYLIILMHELNHLEQFRFIKEQNNAATQKIIDSIYLKELALKKYSSINSLYNFFPDEIDSNIKSLMIIYYLFKNDFKEDFENKMINLFTKFLYYKNDVINSQIKFLYQFLLNKNYDEELENLSEIDKICYGCTKSNETINLMLKSIQTHSLKLDIYERRL